MQARGNALAGRVLWLLAVGMLSITSPAGAIDVLVDVGSCRGIDWVVEDPVVGYLIAGTGFTEPPCAPDGHELIGDNNQPAWAWHEAVSDVYVGESLYQALHPRELQAVHPGMRRVYIATEDQGKLSYFEPNSWIHFQTSPSEFSCGTNIGYRPDLDAVYFGYVNCGMPLTTRIHKHVISTDQTVINYAEILDRWLNSPWVRINGLLYTVTSQRQSRQICFGRQESNDQVYTLIQCYDVLPFDGDANWSTAHYNGGLYYAEFDRTGDGAKGYRVDPGSGNRQELAGGLTFQSAGFLEDVYRNQIYAFTFRRNGDATVACSINGLFTDAPSETVNAPGVAGPPGSVATIWRATNPYSVVWSVSRTARLIPSHGLVARSFLTCR